MNKRIEQIDSMRGLASLTVLFYHITMVTSLSIMSIMVSHYSPLNILISGHSAVILFFMLSGFVLSIPYLKQNKFFYWSFLTKRMFRIYIPYLVAIIFAMFMYLLLSRNGISGLSPWFNKSWNESISLKTLFYHIAMLGNFNCDIYDNAIWSLIQEMRISIIFPIIGLIVVKFNWKTIVTLCIFLSLVSGLNNYFSFEHNYGFNTSFSYTLHYISIFLMGGLVAKYKDDLMSLYNRITKKWKIVVVLIAFSFYDLSWLVTKIAIKIGLINYSEILSDYSVVIGSVLFITIAISSSTVSKLLVKKPIVFLGKVSYSLYLYHLTILFSLVYVLYDVLPIYIIYLITVPCAILISFFSYKYIELPSIILGRKISNKFEIISEKSIRSVQ